jgi:hypothetical protein
VLSVDLRNGEKSFERAVRRREELVRVGESRVDKKRVDSESFIVTQ